MAMKAVSWHPLLVCASAQCPLPARRGLELCRTLVSLPSRRTSTMSSLVVVLAVLILSLPCLLSLTPRSFLRVLPSPGHLTSSRKFSLTTATSSIAVFSKPHVPHIQASVTVWGIWTAHQPDVQPLGGKTPTTENTVSEG